MRSIQNWADIHLYRQRVCQREMSEVEMTINNTSVWSGFTKQDVWKIFWKLYDYIIIKLWINVIFHSTMCFICVFVLRDDKLMSHYIYVYCVCLKYVYSEMTNWCCMLWTICLQWAFCFLHSLSKQIPTDRQMKNLSKVCRPMFGLYWKSLLLLTPALQIPNPDGHRGKIILLCRWPNIFLGGRI